MQRRKEAHRAEKDEEKRTKERQRDQHRKAWRKDKNGNIIFKGAVRISKNALIALIATIAVVVFFAVIIGTNEEVQSDELCRNPFCQLFFGPPIDPNEDIPFVPDVDVEYDEYYDDIVDMEKSIELPPGEP